MLPTILGECILHISTVDDKFLSQFCPDSNLAPEIKSFLSFFIVDGGEKWSNTL